jgi:DNA-binding transcriptional MerR regulator
MTLTEIAESTGLSPEQIRYWVKLGLVAPFSERESEAVSYAWDEDDVRWLLALARLVRAGVPVETLAEDIRCGRLDQTLHDLHAATIRAKRSVPRYLEPDKQ